MKKNLLLTLLWVFLALLFNAGIYIWQGAEIALQFFTGYIIEKALSMDNLFVFMLIFSYFKVPDRLQHKVLFCGIAGALIFRLIFILLGTALLERFHWLMYLFGAFLCITAFRLFFAKQTSYEKNGLIRLCERVFSITKEYQGNRFFVKSKGKWMMTPLFIALITVEYTDILFALDSIPAIFAITSDPFIIYTSNIFALLGLRALYFVLADAMKQMRYFKYGLSALLFFVGAKMLIGYFIPIPVGITLTIILLILLISVLTSLKKRSIE